MWSSYFMSNKKIAILLIGAIVLAGLFVLLLNKYKDTTVVQDENKILFEKIEGWGPCPPNSICHQSTKLYYSGMIIIEGAKELQKQLDKKEITNLIDKIISTDIMNKDCSALIVLDYSAKYKLNINNQEKIIQYPGCEDELQEIEQLILSE